MPAMPDRLLCAPPTLSGVALPFLRALPVLTILAAVLLPATSARAAEPAREILDRVQSLLDAEQAEEALSLLEPLPDEQSDRARALLLRSTARFMLGRLEAGRDDLERALELDPALRQAWLNRAGLDIAEERYEAALEALEEARRLDPDAEDNHLNIGAVYLLQGRIGEATEHFARFLAEAEDRARAHYLVAKNYAGRGYARLAVENLRHAVEGDERYRLLARTDPAFEPVMSSPELLDVLGTDTYTPPATHHRAARDFDAPYEAGDGVLLSAVLESLRRISEPFDPRIEVEREWAVIHGERMRIQIGEAAEDAPGGKAGEDGGSEAVVRLSAPPEAFGSAEWSERTERLFREIQITLVRRQRPQSDQRPDGPPAS